MSAESTAHDAAVFFVKRLMTPNTCVDTVVVVVALPTIRDCARLLAALHGSTDKPQLLDDSSFGDH